ncbi:hypothetical protein Ferp_0503 [Ferroglobus placidus DSM 10642]|uniref:Uncharacterized protein n=1 Tax=Ferroglobus placidus (strain DSM 10642 / AEDII12DO) TaxID=589924 RepID=D3S344_FERPA|nr:hypothetical protein [Ferroglobus placidus]ADC64677.1 hypothetical protein Ferp_0503 [Ferroglobus placidus DSM 10642]
MSSTFAGGDFGYIRIPLDQGARLVITHDTLKIFPLGTTSPAALAEPRAARTRPKADTVAKPITKPSPAEPEIESIGNSVAVAVNGFRFIQLCTGYYPRCSEPKIRIFDWNDWVTVASRRRGPFWPTFRRKDWVLREFRARTMPERIKFMAWLERKSVYSRTTRAFRIYPDGTLENIDYIGTDFRDNIEVYMNNLKYVEGKELLKYSPLVHRFTKELLGESF